MNWQKKTFLPILIFLLSYCPLVLGCPLKVAALCKCHLWIEGLQLDCSFMNFEEVVENLKEADQKIDTLQIQSSNIPVIASGVFGHLSIKQINLAGSNISTVEDGAFAGQAETLQSLDLSNNTLEEFLNITDLGRLESLDLSGNLLTEIPSGIFTETPNLRQLRLERNRICSLNRNVLEETKGFLELLDLSDNCFNSVPAQNLRGSQRLTYLDLSANRISSLPNLQFMNLPVLKELRLNQNRISAISPMAFMNVPNLQQLYIRNNSITGIEPNRFRAFERLQLLDLSFNKIRKIRTSTFKELSNLQQLFLDGNQIEDVETLAFSSNPELKLISLQNNKIQNLFRNAFDSLPQMVTLLLGNNSLTTIGRGVFAGMQNLEQLVLRNNMIQSVEARALKILPELTNLDLGENKLSSVPQDAFDGLENLFWLDLCCNKIETFSEGTFKKRIANILLHGNRFICDQRLDWFITYLVSNAVRTFLPGQPEVLCFGPPKYNGTRLKDVMIKKANESFYEAFKRKHSLTPAGTTIDPAMPLSNLVPALKGIPGLPGVPGLTQAIPGLNGLLSATGTPTGVQAITKPLVDGLGQLVTLGSLKGAVENFAGPLATMMTGGGANPQDLTRMIGAIPGLVGHMPSTDARSGAGLSIPELGGIKMENISPDLLRHVLGGGSIPGIRKEVLDQLVRGYMQKMAQAAKAATDGKRTTSDGVPTTTYLPPLETLPQTVVQKVLEGKALPGLSVEETSTIKNYYFSQVSTPDTAEGNQTGTGTGTMDSETQQQLLSAAELVSYLPRDFDLSGLPQSLLQQVASGQKLHLASIPKEVIEHIRKSNPDLVARLEGNSVAASPPEGDSGHPFLGNLPPTRQTIIPEETFRPYDLSILDRQNEIKNPEAQDDTQLYTAIGLTVVGLATAAIIVYLCYRRRRASTQSVDGEPDRTKFFTSSPRSSFESSSSANNNNLSAFQSQGTTSSGQQPYDAYGRPSPSWVMAAGGLPNYRRTEM